MTKRLLIVSLLALGIVAYSLPAQAETLHEAVEHALITNPQVRAVQHNRLARDQEVEQAKAGYYPTLDFSAGIGRNEIFSPREFEETADPREVKLSLRQNIYNGFITSNEVNRQTERVKSAAFTLQGTSESVALRVAQVYLDVLRHEAIHGLAQENMAIHERIFDQVRLRNESGLDETANLDQVTGRLALAQSNMIVTEVNIIDARTNYHAVVDHFPAGLVAPDYLISLLPASMEEAQAKALENHPTLKSAEADLEARKAQYRVAQGAFSPVIDLEIDKTWEDNIDTPDWKNEIEGMVRFRFNMLNGGKDTARKTETLHLVCEARAIRDNTHRQVVESIRLSWMAFQASQKKITLLKKYVESTGATSEAYTKQWNIGKRTMLDVLDTEAEFINAKRDLTYAIYDSLYAQCRILSGMGSLVHSLGLQWPDEKNLEKEVMENVQAITIKDNG
ncbi:MAG: TolC family outer membrane protein [Desulfobulbaceae bacterium]|uniref:TolC family outer membrane protein n=1 Tax=Candidatus Desulfobia pelagia TaxID=2841692 RepID=A0A8J6NH26_9BACT|nr:TolC family outer membrane protein [Candidatus Desulfobia pelagia]